MQKKETGTFLSAIWTIFVIVTFASKKGVDIKNKTKQNKTKKLSMLGTAAVTDRGGAMGAGGGKGEKPPQRFQKRGKWKNMGYFHALKLLKLAFLSSLTKKWVLWKGFYHDFSTKRASASGDFAPWPHQGALPPGSMTGALPPGPPRWHRPWLPSTC